MGPESTCVYMHRGHWYSLCNARNQRRAPIHKKKPGRNERDIPRPIRRRAGRMMQSTDWAWLDAITGPLDPDMIAAALEQPAQQLRPGLDQLFPEA